MFLCLMAKLCALPSCLMGDAASLAVCSVTALLTSFVLSSVVSLSCSSELCKEMLGVLIWGPQHP